MVRSLNLGDYQSLAELRHQIRRFIYFSEQNARQAGLEPRQHQLMLALKGLPAGRRPRVAEIAERLQIQHHSAVELVNRLSIAGLVRRHRGTHDRREVLLALTARGEKMLRELSLQHRAELRNAGPALVKALRQVTHGRQTVPGAGCQLPPNRKHQKPKPIDLRHLRTSPRIPLTA
jgi:DNA-binding MarR family transcriptional regulator